MDEFIVGDAFASPGYVGHERVDLIVTSPPYYNYRDYGNDNQWATPEEWEEWCIALLSVLKHTLKPSGVVWWNTATGYADNRQMTNVFNMVHHLGEYHGFYLIDTIPWIKTSGPPKMFKNRPYPMVEYNFILSKAPQSVTFYRDNVRRPYSKATLERMKYPVSNLTGDKDGEFLDRKLVMPNEGGASPPNYLLLPQDTTARPHPAAMLPALANWAIRAYSKVGDLVFDPMCGIGTTCIEAAKLDRRFVGLDCNDEYIQLAKISYERLKQGLDPYKELKND
jgi:DNA modification methylase